MKRINPYLLIFFVAAIMFTHSLGTVSLFDWDEINFAESAREMIETGNYMRVQINYEPFWEKPPLFFWMQSAGMHLFDVNEWAARLPNALCGIATLLVLFAIGKRLHNERFAYWWVLLYAGTFLPHLYFKSGIIDPWFNLFIFLGIYFLSLYLKPVSSQEQQAKKHLYLSAVFTGLSVLTKGPVGLLVVILTYILFFFLAKRRFRISFYDLLRWSIGVGLVAMIWFGLEILQHGWWFVEEFVRYQIRLAKTKDAGHGGFFLYHFVVLLIGCFPASWLIFKPRTSEEEKSPSSVFRLMMISSLIVILVLFTLVRTKIVHYSSFAYLPIGYMAAQQMRLNL
jgi:4-amino-4-deoxy-L-arabinose transferase-like glycosyltransferase